jgi:hypothetical protein
MFCFVLSFSSYILSFSLADRLLYMCAKGAAVEAPVLSELKTVKKLGSEMLYERFNRHHLLSVQVQQLREQEALLHCLFLLFVSRPEDTVPWPRRVLQVSGMLVAGQLGPCKGVNCVELSKVMPRAVHTCALLPRLGFAVVLALMDFKGLLEMRFSGKNGDDICGGEDDIDMEGCGSSSPLPEEIAEHPLMSSMLPEQLPESRPGGEKTASMFRHWESLKRIFENRIAVLEGDWSAVEDTADAIICAADAAGKELPSVEGTASSIAERLKQTAVNDQLQGFPELLLLFAWVVALRTVQLLKKESNLESVRYLRV